MFNILSGYETANIKSYPFKQGEVIKDGQWVVFDKSAGALVKQVGAYDPATMGVAFPVFGGNDVRFDSKAMGNVSCVTASSYTGETDVLAQVTIGLGDQLTITDGVITKSTDGKGVIGYCTKPNTTKSRLPSTN